MPNMPTTPEKVPGHIHPLIVPAAIAALFLFAVAGGYYFYQLSNDNRPATNITNTMANVAGEDTNTNLAAPTNTEPPGTPVGAVTWKTPVKTTAPKLFTVSSNSYNPNESALMYEVGTVNTGPFRGGKVMLYSYQEEGPVIYPVYYHLIQQSGKYTLLVKNSDNVQPYAGGPQLDSKLVTLNTTEELADLRFPATLTGPKPRQTLVLDTTVNALFSTEGLTKVFTAETYGTVYTKQTVSPSYTANVDASLSTTAFSTRNGFYLKAPDGTVRVYKLRPDIIPQSTDAYGLSGVPTITWSDGSKNSDTYNFTAHGGCGSINYINVVTPSLVKIDRDLTKTGTTAQGDAIYEFTDSNATRLKDFYAATALYNPDTGTTTQLNYVEFTSSHPMVFWVDPFDRLVELTNARFTPLAECGKPVIYLYPETKTDVAVTLQPQGGFSYTEPVYGDGWQVTAEPNGRLTERRSGKTYPYLFWEGRGGIYTPPTKGFVVARAEVHSFLTDALHRLGLNAQETSDFIAFWEPRMQESPYYRVAFLGRRSMDTLAPLSVRPTPDTVIRVLMDFQPLTQPVTVEPQTLYAPIRRGFTVVEWGGVLRAAPRP